MHNAATMPGTHVLSRILGEQHRLASELLECITNVTDAMTAGSTAQEDTAQLEKLLSRKSSVLDQLDQANNELQAWLTENDFQPNAVTDAIVAQDNHEELLAFWLDFQKLIGDCQLQNLANNSLANGRIVHTRQALDVLTNSDKDENAAYAENGKPSNSH